MADIFQLVLILTKQFLDKILWEYSKNIIYYHSYILVTTVSNLEEKVKVGTDFSVSFVKSLVKEAWVLGFFLLA